MEELSGINNPGTALEPSQVSPDSADDAGDAAYMALRTGEAGLSASPQITFPQDQPSVATQTPADTRKP